MTYKQKEQFVKITTILIQLILGFLFISPLVWMISASLKPETYIFKNMSSITTFLPINFTLNNYIEMFKRSNMITVMFNSIKYISIIIFLGTGINALAGYAIACLDFPFKKFVLSVILAFYIVPFETIIIPLYLTANSLNIINSIWALSLPFISNCFNIFLFKQFFMSFPKELSEASQIDGCSTLGCFSKIVVPNSLPIIATSIVLTVVGSWSDFMWPLIATTDIKLRTVQLGIQLFFTNPPVKYGPIMASLVITTLPIMVLFVFLQKYYVQGITSTGIKG